MIKFGPYKIKGTVGAWTFGRGDVQRRAFVHFGTEGETEIIGGMSGRDISVEVLLHNDYSRDELVKFLQKLENLRGQNYTLEYTEPSEYYVDGGDPHKLENCTLLVSEQLPMGSQQFPDIIQDTAGSVGDANKWIALVRLTWRQLVQQRT